MTATKTVTTTATILAFSLLLNGYFVFSHYKRKELNRQTIEGRERKRIAAKEARKELIYSLPNDSGIVMIGTSLTEGFPAELLGFKNRGIGGLLSSEAIDIPKGKRTLIEVGINDITGDIRLSELFGNYERLIDSTCIVQSVLPVTGDYEKYNTRIDSVNTWLKNYCHKMRIPFINTHDTFLLNGKLDSSLTFDGLHLNKKGYNKWVDILVSQKRKMFRNA